MIYTLMYYDRNNDLAVIRYNTATEFHKLSYGKIPDGIDMGDALPNGSEVQLGHEVTETEISENNLGKTPLLDGKPATWLKPISKFKAASLDDPTTIYPHAYLLMEHLLQDNAIPRFMNGILAMLKANGMLDDNGSRNMQSDPNKKIWGTFDPDGGIKQRVLN